MTTTQIQYQNLLESVFHNRNTEQQAKNELAETKKHNRKTEKQTDYSNKSGRMTAQANVKNAKANTKNAETNAKNAKINEKNAKTNEKNAKANLLKAQAALLQAKAYKDLTVAQIGEKEANTAKIWKDVSNADVTLLTKSGKVGQGLSAAVVAGNILSDPKSSKELKAFARSIIAQVKNDKTGSNKVLKNTAKGIKENSKTWKNVQLTYKNGLWMFVPKKSGSTGKSNKSKSKK